MLGLRLERAGRCVHVASVAWGGVLVWFLIALWASLAWLGPGPAFLAWSAPAFLLAVLTWRWLAAVAAAPARTAVLLVVAAWTVLAVAAWDSGDRLLPPWSFPAFWVSLIGFPFGVTFYMRRLVGKAGPVSGQPNER